MKFQYKILLGIDIEAADRDAADAKFFDTQLGALDENNINWDFLKTEEVVECIG
jgi:hypothetical protein